MSGSPPATSILVGAVPDGVAVLRLAADGEVVSTDVLARDVARALGRALLAHGGDGFAGTFVRAPATIAAGSSS